MNAVTHDAAPVTRNTAGRAAWVCLVIAWVMFLLPLPGTGLFVGWPLNLVAFILAIVAMSKGGARRGIWPLLASLVVSPVVYMIGVGMFASAVGDEMKKAEARTEVAAAANVAAAAEAIAVSPRDLFAAYEANEIAADARFKGKPVKVAATIEEISSGIDDEPVLQLATGEMMQFVHATGVDKQAAAGLSKGQQVTLLCTGGGEMIGMPQLDDCTLQ